MALSGVSGWAPSRAESEAPGVPPWAHPTFDQSVPLPPILALGTLDTGFLTPGQVRRPTLAPPFPASFSHLPRVIFLNQTLTGPSSAENPVLAPTVLGAKFKL